MNTLIHADIFFFITSGAVVVFTVFVIFITIPILRILKNLEEFSRRIRDEGEAVAADIEDLRETIQTEGGRIRSLADFFLGFFPRSRKRSSRSQSHIPTRKKHE